MKSVLLPKALIVVVLGFPAKASLLAQEVYKTVLVAEGFSINVDGDLSDWQGLPVKIQPLENVIITKDIRQKPRDQFDLSANFRCVVGKDNIYVAVTVYDDKIIFGEAGFGETHHDDDVEIYFDGDLVKRDYKIGSHETNYDANDAQIRISKDKMGKVVLEGMGLFGGRLMMLPGLWESLGIVAAIQENPQGYSVELRVPKGVFISTPLVIGSKFGFNVMVNDDDDYGGRDSKISWSADLKDESWLTVNYFGQVVIEEQLTASKKAVSP